MVALIKRIIWIVVLVELAYVVLVNGALNLPLTQQLLNQHRPDKYALHWQRAWSWYPFRAHVRGLELNGQSSSQQWQLGIAEGSASISLLALFDKTVSIEAVEGRDVRYYQRPRPRPGRDYAELREFFPPIAGRDPTSMALPKAQLALDQRGGGWTIELHDVHASGSHEVWVYQTRLAFSGTASSDISYETRGGPFSGSNGSADLVLASLLINGEPLVAEPGKVVGSVSFTPFVPSDHKGVDALEFLNVDLQMQMPVESLDFLDFYLHRFAGMQLDGAGEVSGRLKYSNGRVQAPSDLTVVARELSLQAFSHLSEGSGAVVLEVSEERPDQVRLGLEFERLATRHVDARQALFVGQGMALEAVGPVQLLPVDSSAVVSELRLTLPLVAVEDLSAYQRYVPAHWPLTLYAGRGELSASASLSKTHFDAELRLNSAGADVGARQLRLTTAMELGLQLHTAALAEASVDVSGSYLTLDSSLLAAAAADEGLDGEPAADHAAEQWRSELRIERGVLQLATASSASGQGHRAVLDSLQLGTVQQGLARMDGDFVIAGEVSDLAWIGLLFSNPYQLEVSGSGRMDAVLKLDDGWITGGSRIDVAAPALGAHFLDYEVVGDGRVELVVSGAGQRPDVDLVVAVSDAHFNRDDEPRSFVQDVDLRLIGRARHLASEALRAGAPDVADEVDLQLIIASATVTDMAVYNRYFPADFPLQILGGTAALSADVQLSRDTSEGFVRLDTESFRSRLGEQDIDGHLEADIKLSGGRPADMQFDIAGSSLLLDQVRVSGQTDSFEQQDWSARLDLREASAVWRKPVQLRFDADLQLSDSRPVVAIFSNQRGKHNWLSKMLTVKDIEGDVELQLANNRLLVPYAFASSDKIDVGAKGIIDAQRRDGLFFARYRKLKGSMRISDEQRRFGLIGARKKFDAYQAGVTPPLEPDPNAGLSPLEQAQE